MKKFEMESDTKPTEKSNDKDKKAKPSRLKKIARVFIVLLVVVVGLGYASRGWLIKEAQELVVSQLAKQGIYLSYEKSSRVPLRGLVFENLSIYFSEKKEVPIMVISDIALLPSLSQWLIDREISARITLRDSEISMLSEGKEVEKLEKVNAVIKARIGTINLKSLSGVMNGVDYDISGIIKPNLTAGESDNSEDAKETPAGTEKGALIDFSFWSPLQEWITFDTGNGKLKVVAEFAFKAIDPNGLTANARVTGDSFVWHGVEFDHLQAKIDYLPNEHAVTITSLDLGYRKATAKGNLSYSIESNTLEIVALESQINAMALLNDFSGAKEQAGFTIIKPPHLKIDGRLDFNNLSDSDLKAELIKGESIVVQTGGLKLSLNDARGKLAFSGGKVKTSDSGLSFGIAGGQVNFSGEGKVLEESLPFSGSLKMENLSLVELEKLVGSDQKMQGRLYFDFSGNGSKAAPIQNARGKIKIEDAEFYSTPIFGPLFASLNKIVPAFGKRKDGAKSGEQILTGTYVVQGGVIRSEDLTIGSELSKISVKADYDLQKKIANFNGKAEFKGAVGLVTEIASTLLEVEGGGPLSKIKWKLKNLTPVGLVKGGLEGVLKTGEGAVKLGGNAVKEVGKLGKGLLQIGHKKDKEEKKKDKEEEKKKE